MADTEDTTNLPQLSPMLQKLEDRRIYFQNRYRNNKDAINYKRRIAYKTNPSIKEHSQKRSKKWLEKNRLKRNTYDRVYYVNNRKSKLTKVNIYRINNKDKARARKKKWYALKNGAVISNFTAIQWREMQEHYNHRCVYCNKRSKGRLTQDHITPLSKGGNHTLSNVVPACQSCNSKKYVGPPLKPIQPLLIV